MACFVWVVMILGLRVAPLPCVMSNRALMALDVAAKGLRTLSQQKRTLLSKASQSPLNDVSWCLRAKSSFTELTYGRRDGSVSIGGNWISRQGPHQTLLQSVQKERVLGHCVIHGLCIIHSVNGKPERKRGSL